MFHNSRTTSPAATSTTRIILAIAAAAALAAGPAASATASPAPEPTTTQFGQIPWQDTANELAAEARRSSSLAGRRMLHNELTLFMHSHHAW